MIENFGSYLRNERELRGIPLEEIADSTKIHMRYLKALESNHYDELPGEVFIKGYIRSYGKTIGTNVEDLLAVYDESVGKERKNKIHAGENQTHLKFPQKQNLRSFLFCFLTLLILIAVFIIVKRFYNPSNTPITPTNQNLHSPPKRETPVPPFSSAKANDSTLEPTVFIRENEEDELIPALVPPESGKMMSAEQNRDIAQYSKEQQVRVQKPIPSWINTPSGSVDVNDPLELTIRAHEKSWYKLTIDGTTIQDFILSPGSGKTFRADHSIEVTVGNRKATQMTLNGKPLKLPTTENNTIKNFVIQKPPSTG